MWGKRILEWGNDWREQRGLTGHLNHETTGILLQKSLLLLEPVKQVPALHELHNENEILGSLHRLLESNDIRMVQHLHNLNLRQGSKKDKAANNDPNRERRRDDIEKRKRGERN